MRSRRSVVGLSRLWEPLFLVGLSSLVGGLRGVLVLWDGNSCVGVSCVWWFLRCWFAVSIDSPGLLCCEEFRLRCCRWVCLVWRVLIWRWVIVLLFCFLHGYTCISLVDCFLLCGLLGDDGIRRFLRSLPGFSTMGRSHLVVDAVQGAPRLRSSLVWRFAPHAIVASYQNGSLLADADKRLCAGGGARNTRRLCHLCILVAVRGFRHLTTLLRSHNTEAQPWRRLVKYHNHSIQPEHASFSVRNILLSFPCCSQQTEL